MPVAGKLPTNTAPATDLVRYNRRLGLLSSLETTYAASGAKEEVVGAPEAVSTKPRG